MLRHTEAIASVHVERDAHFFWERTVEFTYDCFVCRRMGRTVFDVARHTLRCRLSYWSSPFQDAKDGTASTALSNASWIRLTFKLGCRACYSAGHGDALGRPGTHSIQTNMVWPWSITCPTCERTLLTADAGPALSLIEP